MKTIGTINKREIIEITLADLKYDRKVYEVVSIKANGRKHTDSFSNLAEAQNWAKWA